MQLLGGVMHVSLRKLLISSTALASFALPGIAWAQDGDPAKSDSDAQADAADDGSPIIITGMRQALEAAAKRKRDADTVVDSITATDIGAFPDKSVAEALQRVPGITVVRTAYADDATHYSAEPSKVLVRGLSQTMTQFNGRESFSATSGTGLNFADISPELLSAVDTYKNQTADMIEGGIAGTIDLRTRLPFDQKGLLVTGTIQANYGDLSEKLRPDASMLISKQFQTSIGLIGVMVGGAYSHINTISQGALLTRMVPYAPGVYSSGINYIPDGFLATRTNYDRERKGFSGAFQWESNSGKLSFTAQYNRSQYDNVAYENSFTSYWAYVPSSEAQGRLFTDPYFIAPPDGGAPYTFGADGLFQQGVISYSLGGGGYGWTDASGAYVPSSTAYFGLLPNGVPYIQPCQAWVRGGVPCRLGVPINTSTRYIGERQRIEDASFNLVWKPTDRLSVKLDYQHIDALSHTEDTTFNMRTFANIDLDLTGKYPHLSLLAPSGYNQYGSDPLSNSANYSPESIMDHLTDSRGQLDAFRADASYKIESPWLDELDVGFRYANRDQQHNWSAYNWQSITSDWQANPADSFFIDSGPTYNPDGSIRFQGYEPGYYQVKTFGKNILNGNLIDQSRFIFLSDSIISNKDELAKRFSPAGQTDQGGTATSFWVPICDRPNEVAGSCYTPGEMLNVRERTKSAYVMLKFGGDQAQIGGIGVRGNIGLRYVESEVRSVGATNFPNQFTSADLTCPALNPTEQAALAANPYLIRPQCLTANSADDIAFSSGSFASSTVTTTHRNWLPSFNLRLDLSRNLLLRFAASKAISKPDIGLLKNFSIIQRDSLTQAQIVPGNPNLVLDAQGRPVSYNYTYSASISNPRLAPIKANQLDLTLEYYSASAGSFSIDLFYKKFSDYIQNGTFLVPYTSNGVTRNVVALGPVNGDGASIKGFELAYQRYFTFLPAPFDGFGVQANYTYVSNSGVKSTNLVVDTNPDGGGTALALSAQAGRINAGRLENLSDHAFNMVLMYEKPRFGFRLAYNWRSEYVSSVNDCCLAFPVWNRPEGFLDGSIRYAFTRNLEFSVQASNLLQTKIRTRVEVQGPTDSAPDTKPVFMPGGTFEYDRRFQAAVRFKF